jgi:hypothetical protein
MTKLSSEYKICPKCGCLWKAHFAEGKPVLCKECGCRWALAVAELHGLADMMDEGKKGKI